MVAALLAHGVPVYWRMLWSAPPPFFYKLADALPTARSVSSSSGGGGGHPGGGTGRPGGGRTSISRLARPSRIASTRPLAPSPKPSAAGMERSTWRPHAISLFPGDFSVELDPWRDDEDDDGDDDIVGGLDANTDITTTTAAVDPFIANLRLQEQLEAKQKQRWLDNAQEPVRGPIIDARGRAYGRGGRKTASARVWIQPAAAALGAHVMVNHQPFTTYFSRASDRDLILHPLVITQTCGQLDVNVLVQGGGKTGQAGAIAHGLAHALNAYQPLCFRPALKRHGLLTRDARRTERKVVGRVKARKRPQWVRR